MQFLIMIYLMFDPVNINDILTKYSCERNNTQIKNVLIKTSFYKIEIYERCHQKIQMVLSI